MAGEVLLRKGHMERDCLRRVSIVAIKMWYDELLYNSIENRVRYGEDDSDTFNALNIEYGIADRCRH